MTVEHICSACTGSRINDLGLIPDGRLLQCLDCGSLDLEVGVDPMSSNPGSYGVAYRNNLDESKTRQIFELFEDATRGVKGLPLTLLDMGCGDGSFLDLARQSGWKVCGIDADAQAAKLTRARGISVVCGTLGRSLPACDPFSVITLWDVIEHVENLEGAMSWLSSALAPNGRLILVTPNANCLLDSIAHFERTITRRMSQRMIHLCLNRYHLHRFTAEGLTRLVRRFGFVPEPVKALQMFSLQPSAYLSGFAPGMKAWTSRASLNSLLSRACYQGIRMSGIRNKLFVQCRKSDRTADSKIFPKRAR